MYKNFNYLILLIDAGDDNVHLRSHHTVWNDAAAKSTGKLNLHNTHTRKIPLAKWLGRMPLAGKLSLICARSMVDRRPLCG